MNQLARWTTLDGDAIVLVDPPDAHRSLVRLPGGDDPATTIRFDTVARWHRWLRALHRAANAADRDEDRWFYDEPHRTVLADLLLVERYDGELGIRTSISVTGPAVDGLISLAEAFASRAPARPSTLPALLFAPRDARSPTGC